MFVVTGVRYLRVHFLAFYYYWAENMVRDYQGNRDIGVPLYAKNFEDSLFRYA